MEARSETPNRYSASPRRSDQVEQEELRGWVTESKGGSSGENSLPKMLTADHSESSLHAYSLSRLSKDPKADPSLHAFEEAESKTYRANQRPVF